MLKRVLPFLVMAFIFSCKEKKVDFSGNVTVNEKDFIAAFHEMNLPTTINDTNIKKHIDSLKFGKKLVAQFIPDSILTKAMNATDKTTINPVGKIEKEKETYLLFNFSNNKKNDLIACVFDDKKKFVTYKPLFSNNTNDGYRHYVSITKEPTFIIAKEKMDNIKQQLKYTKIGWAYTESTKDFIAVVNETNEDEKRNNTIIDPIDTLPKKQKFSGNYVLNERNFITIRDGKKPNTYLFFLHIEKENGTCVGELKGEMTMKTEHEGIFTESGDPCIMDFIFSNNSISVKEQGSCGNYRNIKCYFDDSYQKKKEVIAKKKK